MFHSHNVETITKRAGLTLSVARVQRKSRRGYYAKRIRIAGAVYFTSVLEYLIAEVLELAGDEARYYKKKRISPRHIMLALRSDEELSLLIKDVVFPSSGAVPLDRKM